MTSIFSFTDQKGQAITEFAIMLPIYLLLVFGLIFFGKAYFIKQQTVVAARYAVWQRADKGTTGEELSNQVKKYFFHRLNKERVTVGTVSSADAMNLYNAGSSTAQTNGGQSLPSEGSGSMGGVLSGLMGFMDRLSGTKGYVVSYRLDTVKYLKPVVGEKIHIASTCLVDKNAWSYKQLGNKGFWEVLISMIGDALGIF